jgi:hydroxymethylbilane synthase
MSSSKVIRIGTRDSKLAVWQAEFVGDLLIRSGYEVDLMYVKTEGDLVLDTPLPLMGGKGVFTKALDEALLDGRIDIAVHSHKDIPTRIPDGLKITTVFDREDPRDVLVLRAGVSLSMEELADREGTLATSSMRRQGQWLHRFPQHKVTDIRGNVQTRLRKLDESEWFGAIFAAAGLKRLGLEDRISHYLDWMICAPAQGAIAVMCRSNNQFVSDALQIHHHAETAIAVAAERQCLNRLEGGCSAPVGVYARRENDKLVLFANVLSTDGVDCLDVELSAELSDLDAVSSLGRRAAESLLAAGAANLVKGT